MKLRGGLILLALLFLPSLAHAQQTKCTQGSDSQYADTCNPEVTYDITLTTADIKVLQGVQGGSRTCIMLQSKCSNTNNICLAFGASSGNGAGLPCVSLEPCDPYYVYNLPTGNGQPRVPNTDLHASAVSGTAELTYQYCQ